MAVFTTQMRLLQIQCTNSAFYTLTITTQRSSQLLKRTSLQTVITVVYRDVTRALRQYVQSKQRQTQAPINTILWCLTLAIISKVRCTIHSTKGTPISI